MLRFWRTSSADSGFDAGSNDVQPVLEYELRTSLVRSEERSKTPSSFEYNVEVTRKVVELAHSKGVTVEGEIGVLGGIEDGWQTFGNDSNRNTHHS